MHKSLHELIHEGFFDFTLLKLNYNLISAKRASKYSPAVV